MSTLKKFMGIIVLTFMIFSCTKESEIESTSLSNYKSKSFIDNNCEVNGAETVNPGNSYSYTYSNNFNASSISWSTTGSGITITNGQNTNNVTVQYSSQFVNGTITGSGINGNNNCAKELAISACSAPSSLIIDQNDSSSDCPGAIIYFDADLNGGTTSSGSYQWSVGQGASIVSGQGSSSVSVRAPSSRGFSISVTFTSTCGNQNLSSSTLAKYNSSCGGGVGPGPS